MADRQHRVITRVNCEKGGDGGSAGIWAMTFIWGVAFLALDSALASVIMLM